MVICVVNRYKSFAIWEFSQKKHGWSELCQNETALKSSFQAEQNCSEEFRMQTLGCVTIAAGAETLSRTLCSYLSNLPCCDRDIVNQNYAKMKQL